MKSFVRNFPNGRIRYQFGNYNSHLFDCDWGSDDNCPVSSFELNKFKEWKRKQYLKFNKSYIHLYDSVGFKGRGETDIHWQFEAVPSIEKKGRKCKIKEYINYDDIKGSSKGNKK